MSEAEAPDDLFSRDVCMFLGLNTSFDERG